MTDELTRLSARDAVARLKAKEITPLELIDAAASRIAVGRPRGEAAVLQAAALFEQMTGLDRKLPIEPRAGSVPPV